jgi:hypothetical protein
MPEWILVCPNCSTENKTERKGIVIECGDVYCACVCTNCETEFEGRQGFWRWLGLEEAPSVE